MLTKKELLKNVRKYSPQEIADAVREGTVTLYELGKETGGAFTPLLRSQVKTILDRPVPERKSEVLNGLTNDSQPNLVKEQVNPEPVFAPIPVASFSEPIKDQQEALNKVEIEEQTAKTQIIEDKTMFKKPFSFKGRIRRTEFGLTLLIWFFINFFLGLTLSGLSSLSQDSLAFLTILVIVFSLVNYLFFLAQSVKRCHDIGVSGFYVLIPFYVIVLIFFEGNKEINNYGTSPK